MAYTLDQIMAAIKVQESNGNYKAENPTSTASGAYQYIDGTWNGYGGYAHASDAPAAVQDERMRKDLAAAYKRYGGDWDRVIVGHFTGDGSGDKSGWGATPGTAANHNPTIANYLAGVKSHITGGSGGAAPSGGGGVSSPSGAGEDEDYGYVAQLAAGIPELNLILSRAKMGKWKPEKFTRAVQDSHWWKTTAESRRQAQALRITDPATYLQQVAQASASLKDMALGMGVKGINYDTLARRSISFGLSEAQLKDIIGKKWRPYGGSTGQGAEIKMKLKQLSMQYGLGVPGEWLDQQVRRMLMGDETIDTYVNRFRKMAKSRYVGLADEIDRGMTVAEIAQPYMAMKAQVLEVPETMVSIGSKDIQKALTYKQPGTGPGGKPEAGHAPMQLWQFEQELKKNPLYDKTKGAMQDAYDVLGEIGKGWGFIG